MKLGAVVIPATTLLTADELADRLARGRARAIVAGAGADRAVRGPRHGRRHPPRHRRRRTEGWAATTTPTSARTTSRPTGRPRADDPLLLYFTSGTTAKPKLVRHSHRSYPVGALSTMYWLGLQPGDVHCNISSPGWAKHAWRSFFAPWNAGATVLVINQAPFNAAGAAGAAGALRGHDLLRAADRVAPADPGGPHRPQAVAARGLRRGRAAQPRGHQPGAGAPGASPSATATARPRPRRRSPTRPARR